jgi:hypothetical protein
MNKKPKIYNFKNKFIDVIKDIYQKKYNFTYEIKYFHRILENPLYFSGNETIEIKKIKEIGHNDRNSVFYNDYHEFIDNNKLFNSVYFDFINDYVKPIYSNGNKIIVQKTPNLRISFPDSSAIGKHNYENESDNVIGLHKDADFGHHESEINFIIPITEMFETNSVFYEPYENSKLPKSEYLNLNLKNDEFFIEKFNKLLHFNKINNTGLTRISLDFRIIPYDKYFDNLDYFKNTKFDLGKYYVIV